MYLPLPALARLLHQLAPLLGHARSRLWIDVVDPLVVDGTSGIPEVDRFVEGLARLGDTFAAGIADPAHWCADHGYQAQRIETCGAVLHRGEPIFDLYRFVELRRA